jgi:hypothetical protein
MVGGVLPLLLVRGIEREAARPASKLDGGMARLIQTLASICLSPTRSSPEGCVTL